MDIIYKRSDRTAFIYTGGFRTIRENAQTDRGYGAHEMHVGKHPIVVIMHIARILCGK